MTKECLSIIVFLTCFMFFETVGATSIHRVDDITDISSSESENESPIIMLEEFDKPLSCESSDGEIGFFFEVNNPAVIVTNFFPRISVRNTVNPSTCGGSDGRINLLFENVADGFYDILYDGGSFLDVAVFNNSATIQDVSAGEYENLRIIVNGCSSIDNPRAVLTDPPRPSIFPNDPTDPTNCGGSDGTISLNFTNVPDGTYTISYDDGSFPNINVFNGRATISGLSAGTYSNFKIIVNNCGSLSLIVSITLTDPPGPTISFNGSTNPSTCGGSDGTINLSFTGVPDGIYTISYNSGSFNVNVTNGSGVITNLTAGTYNNLTIMVNGCTSINNPNLNATLTDPPTPTISSNGSTNPTTCDGSDGAINLSFTNVPNGSYTIFYNNGIFNNVNVVNNSATISGVAAGTYSNFSITANGCTSTSSNASATLTDPPTPTISSNSSTNPSTCGGSDGTISLIFTNVPNGNYTISSSSGTFTGVNVSNGSATISGVSAGTYSNFSITANGCTSISSNASVTLTDPSGSSISFNGSTNPTTCGGSDGTISLSFNNVPNGSYTISYNGGSFPNVNVSGGSATISGVSAGTYSNFSIIANGCISTSNLSETLIDPPPPTITSGSSTNPTTCGTSDGSIQLSFTNVPNGNYTITYDGGSFTNVNVSNGSATINNLSAGNYNNLTITANNCTSNNNADATLVSPGGPDPTINSQNPSSCTIANGSFTLNNLQTFVTYEISYIFNGNTITSTETSNNGSITIDGLAAGTYTNIIVRVGNSQDCASNPLSTTLSRPMAPTASLASNDNDNTICSGESITFTANGGGGGAIYEFFVNGQSMQSSNSTTFTISNIANGAQVSVKITNSNDCSDTSESIIVTVNQTNAPAGNANQNFCDGDNPIIADLLLIGSNIQFYDSPIGGNPLPNNTPLNDNTTYYASETQNNCESEERLAVTVTIMQGGNAGQGGIGSTCNDGAPINLNAIITGQDVGGTWIDTDGSGVSLNNTNQVSFLGIQPGSYTFTYSVMGCNNMNTSSEAEVNVTESLISIDAMASNPTVCDTEPINVIGRIESGAGTLAGMWSGGQGFFDNPNEETTIYLPAANEFGMTTLVWSVFDPCTNQVVTSEVNIQINPSVQSTTTGPDQSVEDTTPTTPLEGQVTLSSGQVGTGLWSGGSGFFNDPTDSNTVYMPSDAEIGTIVILTWTADDPDGSGPCLGGQSSTIQITVIDTMEGGIVGVTASPDNQVICSDGEATIMGSATLDDGSAYTIGQWAGGNGIFTPSATSATATYTPSISEIGTIVSLTWQGIDPNTGENIDSNPIQIVVNAAISTVIAEVLNADNIICSTQSIDLSASVILENGEAGSGMWTGGMGIFENASSGNTSYQLGTDEVAGEVTLTWVADDPDGSGPCTGGEPVVVTVTISPGVESIEASGSEVICFAEDGVFSGSVILSNGVSGSGIWTGGLGTFSIDGSTAAYHPVVSEVGQTITLTFIADDPDGSGPCTAGEQQVDLPLAINDGIEIVDAGMDRTICSNESVELSAFAILTSGDNFAAGTWSGGMGTFDLVDQSQTFYHPSENDIGTIELTWTTDDPDGSGPCQAESDVIMLTISSDLGVPIVVNPDDNEICLGDAFPTLEIILDGGETANWYNTPTGGSPLSGGMNTLTFFPPSEGTYYVESIDEMSGCVSARTSIDFIIHDLPTADFDQIGFFNPFVDVFFSDMSIPSSPDPSDCIVDWFWDFGVDASFGPITVNEPLVNEPVQYSSEGDKTVFLKVTDKHGCMNEDEAVFLVTSSDCGVLINAPQSEICQGESITLSISESQYSSGADAWANLDWFIDGVLQEENEDILVVTFDMIGSYNIQLQATDNSSLEPCTVSSNTITIEVNALPSGMISTNTSEICSGEQGEIVFILSDLTTTYDLVYTGGVLENYQSGSPIAIAAPIMGENMFSLTSITDNETGCTNNDINSSTTIFVHPNPSISVVPICVVDDEYQLNISTDGGIAPFTININGETITTSDNPYVSNTLTQSEYTVLLEDNNTCSSNEIVGTFLGCDCFTDAGSIVMTLTSACIGGAITVNEPIGVTLDANDVLNYKIHNGNGTPIGPLQVSPTFTFDSNFLVAGETYVISPVAGDDNGNGFVDVINDNCLSSGTAGVSVNWHPMPEASIQLEEDLVCPGSEVTLIINFTGTLNRYDIEITDSDGNILPMTQNIETNPFIYNIPSDFLPTSATTYTISSLSYNGVIDCIITDVDEVALNLYEPPLITEISTTNNLETLSPITFTPNITFGSSNTIITYEWIFDNSATIQSAPLSDEEETVLYNTNGDKEITLIITDENGCSTTFTQTVSIDVLECNASFEVSTDNTCVGQELIITNTSIVNTDTPVNWNWTFGSNSTPFNSNQENPPNITYGIGGTKDITLMITGQGLVCAPFSREVNVLAAPDVQLQQIEEDVFCENQQVRYLANVTGTPVDSYQFTLIQGDSTTQITTEFPTINVNWGQSGTISVAATNEATMCSDTDIIVVELESAEGTAVDVSEKYVNLIERPSITDSVVFVYQEKNLCYQWYRASKQAVEVEGISSESALVDGATKQYFVTDIFDPENEVVWVKVQQQTNGTCGDCPNYVFYNSATPNIGMIPFLIPSGETDLSLYLYPNPNNGYFQLELNGNAVGQFNISIFDNMGRLLKQQMFEKESPRNITKAIQVEHLSKGIYFLQVLDEKGNSYVKRFVIGS